MAEKEPSSDDQRGGSIVGIPPLQEAVELERRACAAIAEHAWLELTYPDQYSAEVAKLACRKAAKGDPSAGGAALVDNGSAAPACLAIHGR
jgi:hypothetical protein